MVVINWWQWHDSQNNLDNFILFTISFYCPSSSNTVKIPSSKRTVLDTTSTPSNGEIEFNLHTKSTDSQIYDTIHKALKLEGHGSQDKDWITLCQIGFPNTFRKKDTFSAKIFGGTSCCTHNCIYPFSFCSLMWFSFYYLQNHSFSIIGWERKIFQKLIVYFFFFLEWLCLIGINRYASTTVYIY